MENNNNKSNALSFVIIIVSIVLVAGLGSLFVNLGMPWYETLDKPSQYAPNIIFPIVWTTVYLSFIVILILWTIKDEIPQDIVILLIVNGALNVLWCLVFFTLNLTFLGQIVIILNLVASIILWIRIYNEENLYGYILSLYPLWIMIATCLNLSLWILN